MERKQASDHMVVQVESSEVNLVSAEKEIGEYTIQILESNNETEFKEMQTQDSVVPNDLSTPTDFPTYSTVTIANDSNSQSTSSPLAGSLPAPA